MQAGVHEQLWQREFGRRECGKSDAEPERPSRCGPEMFEQTVEAVVEPGIPLIPVVAAMYHVKFVGKMPFF